MRSIPTMQNIRSNLSVNGYLRPIILKNPTVRLDIIILFRIHWICSCNSSSHIVSQFKQMDFAWKVVYHSCSLQCINLLSGSKSPTENSFDIKWLMWTVPILRVRFANIKFSSTCLKGAETHVVNEIPMARPDAKRCSCFFFRN